MGCGASAAAAPAAAASVAGAPAAAPDADLSTIGGGRSTAGDKKFIGWITKSREALAEYRQAAATICVRPEMMAESRTGIAVEYLMVSSKDSSASVSIDAVVLAAVKKAWPELAADDEARSATREVPGLARGNPYQGAKATHDSLQQWQQGLLRLSLSHLTSQTSPDELQISFGMLMRGARECQSRKTWAFYSILTRCMPASTDSADSEGSLAFSRKRILAATREFLDDEKDAAFQTYFIEPSWMYLAAKHDGNPDVIVHGANTYLAVLAAGLGIRLCREPYLADESKGVTPFLDYKFVDGALDALQSEENFGKPWEAIRECKNPRLESGAPNTYHRWLQDGGSPMSNATAALNNAGVRKKARPYLEAFASAFAASRFLPRLFSRLSQSDALVEALNKELQAFHSENLRADAADDGSEEDCRYFLWDLETLPEPTFNLSRALLLFSRIGIIKQKMAPAPLEASTEAAEQPGEQPKLTAKDRSHSEQLMREVSGKLLTEDERETPLLEG